jgi:hypothetical protein
MSANTSLHSQGSPLSAVVQYPEEDELDSNTSPPPSIGSSSFHVAGEASTQLPAPDVSGAVQDHHIEEKLPEKPYSRWSTLSQLYFELATFFFVISFTITSDYLLYNILLSDNPQIGEIRLSQSRQLLVVNILMGAVSMCVLALVCNMFDLLRWKMISRGVSALTFYGLSSATSPLGRTLTFLKPGWHSIWTSQRYALTRVLEKLPVG